MSIANDEGKTLGLNLSSTWMRLLNVLRETANPESVSWVRETKQTNRMKNRTNRMTAWKEDNCPGLEFQKGIPKTMNREINVEKQREPSQFFSSHFFGRCSLSYSLLSHKTRETLNGRDIWYDEFMSLIPTAVIHDWWSMNILDSKNGKGRDL